MNKGMVMGAIVIVLVLVFGAVYFLAGSRSGTQSYSTTVATSSPTINGTSGSKTTAPTTVLPTTTAAVASYSVNLENSSALGSYLANATGFTLYTFGGDVPNSNASSCTSSCAANWPPFYTANLTLSPGLNASNFKTITRIGGAKQLTYKGWPLYLFVGDKAAGQINGNGVGDFKLATR
jgi:predicted lipoprotein with Yx(FWY)xxD motif